MNHTEAKKLRTWATGYYETVRREYVAGRAPMEMAMTAWSFANDAGVSHLELGAIDKKVAMSAARSNPTSCRTRRRAPTRRGSR